MKLTKIVIDGLSLGSAIAITTLPVLFYFYYQYSVYSLLLNLYVIPLMSIVFGVGMVSMAAGFVLPQAGAWLGIPDRVILGLYEISCREVLKLPGAVKIVGRPQIWQIAVYYGVLFYLIFRHNLAAEKEEEERVALRAGKGGRMPRENKVCAENRRNSEALPHLPALNQCLLLLAMIWLLMIRPTYGFSASFLDVGQGDCIVMRNENGNCYMVDGGSTSKSQVGKYQMLPFLESAGIKELKAVFLTHPDEDHISGVVELMAQSAYGVKIDALILPDVAEKMKKKELLELRERAERCGIPVYYIGRGDVLLDRKLRISCLGPKKGFLTDEVNEISSVLYVEYGDFRMMLTGDVTGEAEKELLSELEGREELTILKVAHHGSKYSTPRELLKMTDPVYAVISAGKGNRYGHPHGELTERLAGQGCHTYQTSVSGAITVRVWSGRIRVEEFLRGSGL